MSLRPPAENANKSREEDEVDPVTPDAAEDAPDALERLSAIALTRAKDATQLVSEKVRSPKMRPVRRALAFLLLLLVGGPLSTAMVLRTAWGQHQAQTLLQQALHEQLGLDATLGEVRLELVPVSLSARDVTLHHPEHGLLSSVGRLRARPSWISLLSGTPRLARIDLDRPELRLIIRQGKLLNAPTLHPSKGETNLPFEALGITQAKLIVRVDDSFAAEMKNVSLSARRLGKGIALDLEVRASRGTLTYEGATHGVEKIAASLSIRDTRIALRSLSVVADALALDVTQSTIELSDPIRYDARVAARVEAAGVKSYFPSLSVPDVAGTVTVNGRVWGNSAARPRARGGLSVRNGRIKQFQLASIDLPNIELRAQSIEIKDGVAHLIRDGGKVGISGQIGLEDSLPLQVTATLQDVSFAKLMEQLDVSPDAIVSWDINGTWSIAGTCAPLSLAGPLALDTRDFEVTEGAWHRLPTKHVIGVSRAKLRAQSTITPQGLRYSNIRAETPTSIIAGDVLLSFDELIHVVASSDNLNLADASPLVDIPIAGTGPVHIEVTGTYSDPHVAGRLAFRDFHFNTFPLGNVSSEARLENDNLSVRFPNVTGVMNASRYAMRDLVIDFSQHLELKTVLELEHMTLGDFYQVFHFESDDRFAAYQGDFMGTLPIHFTTGFPTDSAAGTLRVGLDLVAPELSISDFNFTDGRLLGTWTWFDQDKGMEGAEIEITHASMKKGEGTVNATGRLSRGAKLAFDVVADRINVRDTEGLADRMPSLQGHYGAIGRVEGTASIPRMHLDVAMGDLTWSGTHLGDARAYVRLTDIDDPWVAVARTWDKDNLPPEPCARARFGLAHANWESDPPYYTVDGYQPRLDKPMAYLLCGRGLDEHVRVDLAVGKTEEMPLRGRIALRSLDLAPFLPHKAGEDPFAGMLTGNLTFKDGGLTTPEGLVAKGTFRALRISQNALWLQNESPIVMRLKRGTLEVEPAALMGPGSRLSLSGTFSPQQGIEAQIAGNVDLGLAASLAPTIRTATGHARLEINVQGALDAPQVFGNASVRDATLRYASFPQAFEDVQAAVSFDAQHIRIEEVSAQVGAGTVRASGEATLSGRSLATYAFDVSASGIAVAPGPGLNARIGGRGSLRWSGGTELPALGGTITVEEIDYSRPIQLGITVGELTRRERANVEEYHPENDRFALDVRVEQEGPIRIANNLVDAELGIESGERPFRIVGTDGRYGMLGTLVLRSGVFRIRSSEFAIARGSVDFNSPQRIEPTFDVRAQSEIRRTSDATATGWRVLLHAHGSPDNAQVEFSSDPDLAQEDIVLLLTLGMTRAEAEQIQFGDLGSTLAIEALATVTGLDRQIQQVLPLCDEVGFGSAYSQYTNRAEPQVTCGSRINDRVRLNMSTLVSDVPEIRAGLEWQITDTVGLQGVYDRVETVGASIFGNLGVDLRWRLEFE